MIADLRPVAPIALARWYLVSGLGPLVARDRSSGINNLLERCPALVPAHEQLVGAGIDQFPA